jgi:predicted ester cyclase
MAQNYLRAFPDLDFKCEHIIAESDRAAIMWRARGTHRGVLMNIPPTECVVDVRGVSVLTIRDGKIQNGFYLWDIAGLLGSLGLLPEL